MKIPLKWNKQICQEHHHPKKMFCWLKHSQEGSCSNCQKGGRSTMCGSHVASPQPQDTLTRVLWHFNGQQIYCSMCSCGLKTSGQVGSSQKCTLQPICNSLYWLPHWNLPENIPGPRNSLSRLHTQANLGFQWIHLASNFLPAVWRLTSCVYTRAICLLFTFVASHSSKEFSTDNTGLSPSNLTETLWVQFSWDAGTGPRPPCKLHNQGWVDLLCGPQHWNPRLFLLSCTGSVVFLHGMRKLCNNSKGDKT